VGGGGGVAGLLVALCTVETGTRYSKLGKLPECYYYFIN